MRAVAGLLLVGCTTPFDPALLCIDLPDGAPCDGGTCHEGGCCRGCWTGSECLPGDQDSICGARGATCVECRSPAARCVANACGPLHAIVSVAAGGTHTCAVDDAGGLFCFGANISDALGTGGSPSSTSDPIRLAGDDWLRVEVRIDHSCAVHATGSLFCWGRNGDGELGVEEVRPDVGGDNRSVPTEVLEPGPWRSSACGDAFACGLKEGGELFCWGWNGGGRLGFDQSRQGIPERFPTGDRFTAVSLGHAHGCAITIEGALVCWGENDLGQVGQGPATSAPIGSVAPGSTWRSISAGTAHTCGVRTDGSLWCWGSNAAGQLGSMEPAMSPEPLQVDPASDWSEASAGDDFTCARKTDGRVLCFGSNDDGRLGDGTDVARTIPAEVLGDHRFTRIDAGGGHACAIAESGLLFCWGSSSHAQNGATVTLTQPTAVSFP
jgi:hypothetical protein